MDGNVKIWHVLLIAAIYAGWIWYDGKYGRNNKPPGMIITSGTVPQSTGIKQ